MLRAWRTPAFRCFRKRCCWPASTTRRMSWVELMRALVECRIKPYYLHHGDLAPGTSHLRTGIATGQRADALSPRASVRPVSADLRTRHSRWPRQIADWPELHRAHRIKRSWRILSWRTSTGSGINIRRQWLMSDRHEVEERRGHRKRRRKPMNTTAITACHTKVASRRSADHHVLAVDHCLTFPEKSPPHGQRILVAARNHPARNLYVKKCVRCAATSHGRYE